MTAATDVLTLLEGGKIDAGGVVITAAEIQKLKTIPWSDFIDALNLRALTLDKVALVAEDILAVAGDFGFAPAPIIIIAIKAAVFAIDDGTQDKPGALNRIASGARGSNPNLAQD